MGSDSSKEVSEDMIMDNYRLLNSEDDKRFGDISIYKNKQNGELVWIKEVYIDDQRSMAFYKTYLDHKSHQKDCFIASNPFIISNNSSSNFCGNCSGGNKIVTVMEFFERDLEGEVMRRNQDVVNFFFFKNFFF